MKTKLVGICGVSISLWAVATMSVNAGLIENPSFEFNFNDVWPHYGPIDSWGEGSGTNMEDGPFHNVGTPVPDGFQVAFMQGSPNLSQDIFDLEPGKQYAVQFFYDARNGAATIDLTTQIDGEEIDRIVNVRPVTDGDPYKFRSVPFTPEFDT
ncbi:MAG: hypothetical protein ACI9R3_006063, partial [Verrucomicrobiales bacterium]